MRIRTLFSNYEIGNASGVTVSLLRCLGVPVTTKTAVDTVEHHPDFPSLLAISESLDKWKIGNKAIEVEPEGLNDIPLPFIAHGRSNGGWFMLVTAVDGPVEYTDPTGGRSKISRDDFLKEWSGVALVAEKTKDSGDPEYRKKTKEDRINEMIFPFIFLCCIGSVVLHFFVTPTFSIYTVGIAMTLLTGSVVSALLLWFEIDNGNPVLNHFCTGGKHTNCEAVLKSKQSRLLNWISWSEIGFFYFAGSFLALVITPSNAMLGVLAWLNVLTFPYTIFSVYYQWRVVKKWCKLCLIIQGLLVTQLFANYFGYWVSSTPFRIEGTQFVIIILSFLLPIFYWTSTKRVYVSAQQGRRDKKDLNRLKYNKDVFASLLQKQKKITITTEGLGILLGNPDAEHTIIKVCNPYCSPCSRAHRTLDEILDENPNVKVQIIFSISNGMQDLITLPVRHLLALYDINHKGIMKNTLDDWYNTDKKDYETFAEKYILNGELELQQGKIEKMSHWCEEVGITFTPTLFFNGYQLPKQYNIEDLKSLI